MKPAAVSQVSEKQNVPFDTLTNTLHIFVALCDNKYQGIVPVPAGIGNGQDPNTNLYWGCGYGIRTYFKKSKEWKLVKTIKKDSLVLERLVFKHATKNCYLVADAYDGQYIKQCTQDFLAAANGAAKDTLNLNGKTLGISGNSSFVGYIGHDGLMDFDVDEVYKNTDGKTRNVVVLACFSKSYFSQHLDKEKVNPLVWTTHLMCPEAYTIHDAITGYLAGEGNAAIRKRAVSAYAKYQKCGEKAAGNLLVTGW
ncbi:hypothetical protein AM493_09020 [Flavobacterium akiainvivens]|uniref:Uncharacterized protein n=1 Tax=Flavobacterium akiainvivens TaxID=1202724 RepID=A0A0N0RR58_9FLAO|nr:hypothetical protein AM493_09020 [Flavobacterium akiainvivens]